MTDICFDLRTVRHRYRLFWADERDGESRDPWYREIRCSPRGTICPWGQAMLAYTVSNRRPTVRKLIALGCKLIQDGDAEQTVIFPSTMLDVVAKLTGARRRVQLSPEERQRRVDLMARIRVVHPVKTILDRP